MLCSGSGNGGHEIIVVIRHGYYDAVAAVTVVAIAIAVTMVVAVAVAVGLFPLVVSQKVNDTGVGFGNKQYEHLS